MKDKLPQSEFSPDPDPRLRPVADKAAPPSQSRRNLEDHYLAPDHRQPRNGRVA